MTAKFREEGVHTQHSHMLTHIRKKVKKRYTIKRRQAGFGQEFKRALFMEDVKIL